MGRDADRSTSYWPGTGAAAASYLRQSLALYQALGKSRKPPRWWLTTICKLTVRLSRYGRSVPIRPDDPMSARVMWWQG